jgi:salicylate hydroxylase
LLIRGATVTRKEDPILIVGGGLGGATVALALARKGVRVRLIEQAPEFGVIGYGIQLGPNVFLMFDRLGLGDAVLAAALRPNAVLMVDSADGGVIARIPTGASFVKRFKRPYIVIHRTDLHGILLDACRAASHVEFMPNTGIASYEDTASGVRVRTTDGRAIDGCQT